MGDGGRTTGGSRTEEEKAEAEVEATGDGERKGRVVTSMTGGVRAGGGERG